MGNLWSFLQNLLNIIINLGSKLWTFLTTPIMDLFRVEELPNILSWFGSGISWLFGDNGIYPNANILALLPMIIILALVIRLLMLILGRG